MSKTILIMITSFLSLLPFTANAQALTHLGQPPGQHVTLDYRFDANNLCGNSRIFFQRSPNGTVASNHFRVPSGKFFIITDLVWEAAPGAGSGGNFLAGRTLRVTVTSRTSNGLQNRLVFISSPINLTAELAGPNQVGGSYHLIAGVRVGTGRVLCAGANSIHPSGGSAHSVRAAEIHGYLVNK